GGAAAGRVVSRPAVRSRARRGRRSMVGSSGPLSRKRQSATGSPPLEGRGRGRGYVFYQGTSSLIVAGSRQLTLLHATRVTLTSSAPVSPLARWTVALMATLSL